MTDSSTSSPSINRFRKAHAVVALSLWVLAPSGMAAIHHNKELAIIHTPDDRPCVFFQLVGVTEADPAAPNPWFALAKAHPGYKEAFATLMLARAMGRPLAHVVTSGMACGHAAAHSMSF